MYIWDAKYFHALVLLIILGIANRNSFLSPFSYPTYNYFCLLSIFSTTSQFILLFHILTAFTPHSLNLARFLQLPIKSYAIDTCTSLVWTTSAAHHDRNMRVPAHPHGYSKAALTCTGSRSAVGEQHSISVLPRHSVEAWCTTLFPNIMLIL